MWEEHTPTSQILKHSLLVAFVAVLVPQNVHIAPVHKGMLSIWLSG